MSAASKSRSRSAAANSSRSPSTTSSLEEFVHAQRTRAFAGKPIDREALFWEHEGNRAVRAGRSRLVAVRYNLWHLFNLDADRTERNDLALRYPETITALSARWDDWARRSKVLSFPPGRMARKN
jgi:hypothetical protein